MGWKKHRRNKHHLIPRSRHGNGHVSNLLRMKVDRHAKLHRMFGNMTWEEIHDALADIFGVGEPHRVVQVMERVREAKRNQVA